MKNNLSELPASIGNLSKLKKLNPLKKFPSFFRELPNLRFIGLYKDQQKRFSKDMREQGIVEYYGNVMEII